MVQISDLNANQKEAVLDDSKYLRIVAGAGSGKTRVLTMRIVHLIEEENVYPNKILAITFTNKAANEMKERIRQMLQNEVTQPWISTIHSLCVRILREDITCMGWPKNFTVLDADDQKTILKEAYKQIQIDANTYPFGSMLDYISNNKGAEISVDRAFELAGDFSGDKTKAEVYKYYVKRQNDMYALDFDDLILWVVRMFKTYSEVLTKWQNRFSYIHVDEFQDIDKIQYKLIKQLTGPFNHLYVVGDPDQTIYSWRGADVNIIMNFEKDFKGVKTIMLNENYRSTSCILNGANSVIRNNKNRLDKELFTSRTSNEKITHYASANDEYEAAYVANKISELHREGKAYKDIAVLYRSNYLSRSIEKALLDERIPYIIYGGLRFYDRQEVKDALCYLRLVVIGDDLALQRIINKPKRGIGNKTMELIADTARNENKTMLEVLETENIFSGKAKVTLNDFVNKVNRWKKMAESKKIETFALFETILDESGYKAMLEEDHETDRLENLKELIDDIKEFTENYPDSSLDEYLQQVSLYGDREETMSGDYIQLMTVHAAKGLEFDTVFVTDMNDGIFPNERAMNEGSRGVEEERRLAYVAFTRAKNKLYLTEAGGFSFILQRARQTSRFIKEIDDEYIENTGVGNEEHDAFRNRQTLYGQRRENTFYERDEKRELYSFSEKGEVESIKREVSSSGYKTGDHLTHVKFGEGVVISCKGGIVEIAFPYPYGVKKIAAGHPSLKKKLS
ncbi:MAG: UvrD-helicase domain-containing protein [Erysipelotrichaceae bacterium]|nr:UvrD-helicase domain-containing protein [Erysipelotrichaceae bacterium]